MAGATFLGGVGMWLDFSEDPQVSDYIVVLAGGYPRSRYAADLYHQGYAPEIWLSRPQRNDGDVVAERYGFKPPREEEVNRAILLRHGVPADKIKLYGRETVNTVDEARSFREAVETGGKKILVVTSRTHARRARWIFAESLRGADVRVSATPYERFTRRWWTNKWLVREGLIEAAKVIYLWIGGDFLSTEGPSTAAVAPPAGR